MKRLENEEGEGREVEGRRIDYLGYVFSRNNVRLRKSVKHNFAIKVKRSSNTNRLKQVKASYWGWCKWGNCRHLWRVITDNDMGFASKGITSNNKTKDGKKYYQVKSVSITDILNVPIRVLDFETGITTSKGKDRYAVLYETASNLSHRPLKSRMCLTRQEGLKNRARKSFRWIMRSSARELSVMERALIILMNKNCTI